MSNYFLWACALGALSAASLPLGSWVGLRFGFSPRQISILAAFGAGALLAALSVELIAPTTLALSAESADTTSFFVLMAGCVIGGLAYVGLDHLVNQQGGFLRKTSTLMRYYQRAAAAEQEELLGRLASVPLFQSFPPDEIKTLISTLEPMSFEPGDVLLTEGEPVEAAYLLLEGKVKASVDGELVQVVDSSEGIIGLLPLFTGVNSPATGVVTEPVKCVKVSKEGFDALRALSPEFDQSCREITAERLELLSGLVTRREEKVRDWLETSRQGVIAGIEIPPPPILRQLKEERHGAPLAIWLGILLDGIPESLVIGAGMLGMLSTAMAANGEVGFLQVVPFTLVAGLFLSNFPEALSSSANMLDLGWSRSRIFFMWFALMLITAVGAGVGYLLAGVLDHTWLVFFEGLAAGAMLTMIAAAMIPEAVLMGSGNSVGLATLTGFLAALLFKLLE